MWTAADVSGAARTSPTIPKRAPALSVTISTISGLRPRVAPKAIGWRMFWSIPFASSTIASMIAAVVGPSAPSASTTANPPATNAPI